MEAKAALEARALALAEEAARANARAAKLEADVTEHARVLELERVELAKERDAHAATRNALRANALAASRREAALAFSLDVQANKAKETRREGEEVSRKRAGPSPDGGLATSRGGVAEGEKNARDGGGAKRLEAATTRTEATTQTESRGRAVTLDDDAAAHQRECASMIERDAGSTERGLEGLEGDLETRASARAASASDSPRGESPGEEASVSSVSVSVSSSRETREDPAQNDTPAATLAVELKGVRRAHAAATRTCASLRAALDAAEQRAATLELEADRNRAASVAWCARDAVRAAASDALESLLEAAAADAARFRAECEAARADARRLEGAAAERDAAERGRERERRRRADAEAALAEARAAARDALAREPARAGEVLGHASAREDALRARDGALERAAALETLLEAERACAAEARAAAAAAETARDVADGRAREAEGRAVRAETHASVMETRSAKSSADAASRVAALESELADARAASGTARRELASARVTARAAADAAEARARDARSETQALTERVSRVIAERDVSIRDAASLEGSLEETKRALETTTRETRDAARARFEEATSAAATASAKHAFALSFIFSTQLVRLQAVAKRARGAWRVSRAVAKRARDATADAQARVARLERKAASLESALGEARSRTEREIEKRASLVERGEEAERVSRLRVAYARECERRLAVTEAEKIRLARALEALGGGKALETRRAARG